MEIDYFLYSLPSPNHQSPQVCYRLLRVFLALTKPSKPSSVLYQPCIEKAYISFYEPYMKLYLPILWDKFLFSSSIVCEVTVCATCCINGFWAAFQSIACVSANQRVSLGSISNPLKILSFHPFQIYQKIRWIVHFYVRCNPPKIVHIRENRLHGKASRWVRNSGLGPYMNGWRAFK